MQFIASLAFTEQEFGNGMQTLNLIKRKKYYKCVVNVLPNESKDLGIFFKDLIFKLTAYETISTPQCFRSQGPLG